MDQIFLFDFRGATAWYLILYLGTWIGHQALIDYVVVGAALLGWSAWRETPGKTRVVYLVRDWLPFFLSAAITVGIAPLLFIQILYQEHFYSAQVLLWTRWIPLGPILIVGFYFLYVVKSKSYKASPRWWRTLISVATSLCFLFAAYCWADNHLLSLHRHAWPDFYVTGVFPYPRYVLVLRLLTWCSAAVPVFCLIVGWQSWAQIEPPPAGETHWLARLAIGSCLATPVIATVYVSTLYAGVVWTLAGIIPGVALVAWLSGYVLQAFCWWRLDGQANWSSKLLWLASLGALLSTGGWALVREQIRWGYLALDASFPLEKFYAQHAEYAQVGGLGVFLFFLVLNGLLCAWCIWLVRHFLVRAQREELAAHYDDK